MQYEYETERVRLASPKGIEIMGMVAFAARQWVRTAGAFTLHAMWHYVLQTATTDEWLVMACVDYMVEAGILREIQQRYDDVIYSRRAFVAGHKFNPPKQDLQLF